jgi:hypothetical protein
MANMWVNRNGALVVRPGLRYLSYHAAPDSDEEAETFRLIGISGAGCQTQLVGTQEPFFLPNGSRALLQAVREEDGTIGFRALDMSAPKYIIRELTDSSIGFRVEGDINFSAETTYVRYVQIDNKILAMSDAGEPLRVFYVGEHKLAKRLPDTGVGRPLWSVEDKPSIYHPSAAWINDSSEIIRYNLALNPAFELGLDKWYASTTCLAESVLLNKDSPFQPIRGARVIRLKSLAARVNIQTSPLHDVKNASFGIANWAGSTAYKSPRLSASGEYMRITPTAKGLFLAVGAKCSTYVKGGGKYRLSVDFKYGATVQPRAAIFYYNAAGNQIGPAVILKPPRSETRWVSGVLTAPAGTVTMRVGLGGDTTTTATYVDAKNVLLCRNGEASTFFEPGGADVAWAGTPNLSALVYHPPQQVRLRSTKVGITQKRSVNASIHVRTKNTEGVRCQIVLYDKNGIEVQTHETHTMATGGTWTRVNAGVPYVNGETLVDVNPNAVSAELLLKVDGIRRGEEAYVDAAMIESGTSVAMSYFDGGSADISGKADYTWTVANKPHLCSSKAVLKNANEGIPPKNESPGAKSLVATGGSATNTYKLAVFYTFENDIGETAPSQVTEIRMFRPWSNWLWETAANDGGPSGTATTDPTDSCDQLIVTIPQSAYDQAIKEGAWRWNLYGAAWSDQQVAPVLAQLLDRRVITSDPDGNLNEAAKPYETAGWLALTPSRKVFSVEVAMPSADVRNNYTIPPKVANGLVVADRVVVVGDADDVAKIRWTSSRPGEYINFAGSVGGGVKTLSSGNMNVPLSIVLWQNPQSVDTLTILCRAMDGASSTYYMIPSTVTTQTASAWVMGFEETTNTPGTVAIHATEVLNNALYRPLDYTYLKSTAANYNINHTQTTDNISNMWTDLQNKRNMVSASLDNRIYLLVHNPYGERLEDGCRGNEIWILDAGKEGGSWSRWTLQATCIRPLTIANRLYMSVTRPEGLYYLDPYARDDDYVTDVGGFRVVQHGKPIEWSFETNTQGANRAHDAWSYLQQVLMTVGRFEGTMRYGIRGKDSNGMDVDVSKILSDERTTERHELRWDIQDSLIIRRAMKEWALYGSSVEGHKSSGSIELVQYRYTPVSVNIGSELGSVETFEYGANVAGGANAYSENGVPLPYADTARD